MPDILTHVLIGYCLGTLLSVRTDWLDTRFVTVVMLGTLLPDLTKVKLLVSDAVVETTIGIPFSWFAIHTPIGSLIASAIGALLAGDGYRKRVLGLLLLGAFSHHLLDAMLIKPSGYSNPLLWPLSTYHFPTPNLYLSSDRWPAFVAGIGATALWVVRQRRS